ncbi:hypothetical protein G6F62_003630 [Rhizopus arrhizus]|nr:hypothetical protein G6F62_003630 [Rhizopus arrhizus]
MNMQFLYEDGQGRVVDENRIEPIDLVVDEELFAIETISFHTQFLMNKPPERPSNIVVPPITDEMNNNVDMELYNKRCYTVYSEEDKTRFFHLFFSKCLNASAAARQLDIHIRAAQRWVKRYYQDPESIFKKKKKSGRPRILGEEHKQFLFNYIDKNPSAVVTEVQKWQRTDLGFTTNCVFLDESAFHINLKRGMAWSKKGTPAIVTVPTTKANATSILSAISATGLINVSLRVPKRIKKRKLGREIGGYSTGTVIGHYLSFLKATLDEMDRYPEMKGHYLVMDNTPIHSSLDIGSIFTAEDIATFTFLHTLLN